MLSPPVAQILLTPRWVSKRKYVKLLCITIGGKHFTSCRTTFSPNPHLAEEATYFPFFTQSYSKWGHHSNFKPLYFFFYKKISHAQKVKKLQKLQKPQKLTTSIKSLKTTKSIKSIKSIKNTKRTKRKQATFLLLDVFYAHKKHKKHKKRKKHKASNKRFSSS